MYNNQQRNKIRMIKLVYIIRSAAVSVPSFDGYIYSKRGTINILCAKYSVYEKEAR